MDQYRENTNNIPRTPRFWHNTLQGIITILVILTMFISEMMRPIFTYRAGLENFHGNFALAVLWMPAFVFLFICFLAFVQLITLIVFKSVSHVKIGYKPLLLLFISLFTIVAFLLPLRPSRPYFTEGFRDRMKHEVNVPEVQEWLKTLEKPMASRRYIIDPCGPPDDLESYGSETIFIKSLDATEWPKTIRDLNPNPKIIYVQPYKNQEATIRLEWGWVASDWGIVVGSSDMEVPKSDMKRGGEYRLKLAPGAYVWQDVR